MTFSHFFLSTLSCIEPSNESPNDTGARAKIPSTKDRTLDKRMRNELAKERRAWSLPSCTHPPIPLFDRCDELSSRRICDALPVFDAWKSSPSRPIVYLFLFLSLYPFLSLSLSQSAVGQLLFSLETAHREDYSTAKRRAFPEVTPAAPNRSQRAPTQDEKETLIGDFRRFRRALTDSAFDS